MKIVRAAGALIYHEESRTFLIIKQVRGNFWGFPKGHIENNESELDAAKREVKEETDLEPEFIPEFKREVSYKVGNFTKAVTYFLAISKTKDVNYNLPELEAHEWLTHEEAKQKLTFDNTKQILDEAISFFK